MPIELYPAIDLRGGRVVRLLRGDYLQQTVYDVDPLDIARRFSDAGCRWLHVVDLDGAKDGRPVNLTIIEKLIERSGMQVQVGGGDSHRGSDGVPAGGGRCARHPRYAGYP